LDAGCGGAGDVAEVVAGVVDGLFDSEQPATATIIVTTTTGVTRRIVKMLTTANCSTVARTRWWLTVFTFR
jgi:hypothetical protein